MRSEGLQSLALVSHQPLVMAAALAGLVTALAGLGLSRSRWPLPLLAAGGGASLLAGAWLFFWARGAAGGALAVQLVAAAFLLVGGSQLLLLSTGRRFGIAVAGVFAVLGGVLALAGLVGGTVRLPGFGTWPQTLVPSAGCLIASSGVTLLTIRRHERSLGRGAPSWAVIAAVLAGGTLTFLTSWSLLKWQHQVLLAQTRVEAQATARHLALLVDGRLGRLSSRLGRQGQLDDSISPGLLLVAEVESTGLVPWFVSDEGARLLQDAVVRSELQRAHAGRFEGAALLSVLLPGERPAVLGIWPRPDGSRIVVLWDAARFFEPVIEATTSRDAELTIYLNGEPLLRVGQAASDAPAALAPAPVEGVSSGIFRVAVRLGPTRVAPFQVPLPLVVAMVGSLATGALASAFLLAWRRAALAQELRRLNAQLTEEIDERRQIEKLLAEREARLRALLRQLPAIVWTVDRNLVFTSSAGSGLAALGLEPGQVVGMTLFEYFGTDDPDHPAIAAHQRALAGEPQEYEFAWQDRWYRVRVEPLTDPDGAITGAIGIAFDVTEQKQVQQELERLATTDELTGLANRAAILGSLDRLLANGNAVALLLIDLDGFKKINDTLGHLAGDAVLRQVAARLRRAVRREDLVGRLGGDEFLVVVKNVSVEEARELAARLLLALSQPFLLEDRTITLGGSIGIVVHEATASVSATELLRRADLALYESKRRGRGRMTVYSEVLEEAASRELELPWQRGDLEQTIDLVGYPVVELRTGALSGFAVVPRWHDADQGYLEGRELAQLAERVGIAFPLGLAVLQELDAWLAILPDDERTLVVLTYPSRALLESELVTGLVALRERFPRGNFWIDVPTEGLLDPRSETALERIATARIGVMVSQPVLTPEGVGPLARLPLAGLRLPAGFVRGLLVDEVSGVLVRALLEVAHGLNLVSLADGIEEFAHLVALTRSGCRLGTGPLFGPPRDPDEGRLLLASRPHWQLLRQGDEGTRSPLTAVHRTATATDGVGPLPHPGPHGRESDRSPDEFTGSEAVPES